jgi:hypothetical protein
MVDLKKVIIMVKKFEFHGDEPKWDGKIAERLKVMDALNWYSYCINDDKKRLSFLKTYFKDDPKKLKIVTQTKSKITPTVCYLARMLTMGCKPHPSVKAEEFIEKRLAEYADDLDTSKKESTKKVSVQDHINAKTLEVVEVIEEAIDDYIAFGDSFSTKAQLEFMEVKSIHATKVAKTYEHMLKEEYTKENYKDLSAAQYKGLVAFINGIIDESNEFAKVNRKKVVRVSKPKPASKQVAKMKFLQSFKKLKLESINPQKIIGAEEVWLFDTKYNKLRVLYATDRGGFTVKGTTIGNVDMEYCLHKTLRKPKEMLDTVMGLRSYNKVFEFFEELSTTWAPVNGRVNESQIILKVK